MCRTNKISYAMFRYLGGDFFLLDVTRGLKRIEREKERKKVNRTFSALFLQMPTNTRLQVGM